MDNEISVNAAQLAQAMFEWEARARLKEGEAVPEEEQERPIQLEFPAEGGIKIYLQKVKPENTYKEPMLSFPSPTGILINAYVKKLLPMSLRKFSKMNIFKKVMFLLMTNDFKELIIEYDEWLTASYILKPREYSHFIKELFLAMSQLGIDTIRNLLCFHLEYDLAYKYRAQDWWSLINRWAFVGPRENILKSLVRFIFKRKYPEAIEEIKRVLTIAAERENNIYMRAKMVMMFKFLYLFLLFRPKVLEIVKKVILRVDAEKAVMGKEEIYWTNFRYPDYNFRGMTQEEREQDNIKRYGVKI